MKSHTNLNYQLGLLAGEIIYEKYLPTLSTDMLTSKVVIEVTDKEILEKHNNFQQLMKENLGNEKEYKKVHKEWLEFYKPVIKKYIPKTLECRIQQIHPEDLDLFKKGLNDYLWHTDLSHYIAKDDFFEPNIDFAWCSTIKLTRD